VILAGHGDFLFFFSPPAGGGSALSFFFPQECSERDVFLSDRQPFSLLFPFRRRLFFPFRISGPAPLPRSSVPPFFPPPLQVSHFIQPPGQLFFHIWKRAISVSCENSFGFSLSPRESAFFPVGPPGGIFPFGQETSPLRGGWPPFSLDECRNAVSCRLVFGLGGVPWVFLLLLPLTFQVPG